MSFSTKVCVIKNQLIFSGLNPKFNIPHDVNIRYPYNAQDTVDMVHTVLSKEVGFKNPEDIIMIELIKR